MNSGNELNSGYKTNSTNLRRWIKKQKQWRENKVKYKWALK